MVTENARMRQLRDTAANLAAVDPVLLDGEIAVTIDINRIKIGDGTSAWSALPYLDVGNAPNDGKLYGRLYDSWADLDTTYLNKQTGGTMSADINYNVSSRLQLFNSDDGSVRIAAHRGDVDRPFRFIPAINGAEDFSESLAYSAADRAWYLGNFYSEETQLLAPFISDEYYPTVRNATVFPFINGADKYVRFIQNHAQLNIASWNDLSPDSDGDWPYNQMMVRVGGTGFPTEGWPNQAAGDYLQSHSYGVGNAFQTAYAVSESSPSPSIYMRRKINNVWDEWNPIGGQQSASFSAQYDPLVLTAVYQPLVLQAGEVVPTEVGTFSASIAVKVIDTGGNGSFQFRITQGGGVIAQGVNNTIAGTHFITVPLIYQTDGTDPLVLEALGNNCTVEQAGLTSVRVGA